MKFPSHRSLNVLLSGLVFLSGASRLVGQTKQDMQLPELLFGKTDVKAATKSQLDFKDIPTDGPVNPDEYHVGPGDGLVLDVWSSAPVEHQLRVTPEGYLLIPSVGAVAVQDLTLKEVREKIVALGAKRYPGATITLTLVSPRKVSVEITGQVMNEGMQEVYSVQRISALIEQANTLPSTQLTRKFYDQDKQELRRVASQRFIVARHRDGSSQRVDLVKYALTGNGAYNPYLREGDNVYVPGRQDVDNRIGVFGGVVKNISVEYAAGDSITDLVQLGLGLSPLAVPETATLMRQSLDGRVMASVAVNLRALAERRLPNIALQPGDRLVVPRGHDERVGSIVIVEGEVLRPGKYPITRNTTMLSQVIREAGGFTSSKSARMHCITLLRTLCWECCAPVWGSRVWPKWKPRSAAAERNPSGNSNGGLSITSKSSRMRYCHCMAPAVSPARYMSYILRVISGTTFELACVPPSQPIISMGISTASHPVRKVKSGRLWRIAAIMRIMKARSPEESLMPMTRGNPSARRRMVVTSMGLAKAGML